MKYLTITAIVFLTISLFLTGVQKKTMMMAMEAEVAEAVELPLSK
jgi:hypothetical protein